MSDKRDAILKSALSLFCNEGFQATSTARISREAGVATGTLFTYFESKDVLINSLYLESKEKMAREVLSGLPSSDIDPKSRMQAVWNAMIEFGVANPEVFRFIMIFKNSPFVRRVTKEEAMGKWEDIYTLMHHMMVQKKSHSLSPDILTMMLTAQLNAVTEFLIDNAVSVSQLNEILSETFDMTWNSFFE